MNDDRFDIVFREVEPYRGPRDFTDEGPKEHSYEDNATLLDFVAYWPPQYEFNVHIKTLPPGTYVVYTASKQKHDMNGVSYPASIKPEVWEVPDYENGTPLERRPKPKKLTRLKPKKGKDGNKTS